MTCTLSYEITVSEDGKTITVHRRINVDNTNLAENLVLTAVRNKVDVAVKSIAKLMTDPTDWRKIVT